jgi:SAM-dependent methyltransferase
VNPTSTPTAAPTASSPADRTTGEPPSADRATSGSARRDDPRSRPHDVGADARPAPDRRALPARPAGRLELFRLALTEEDDPEPFYTKLAERSISELPFPVRSRRILDLGSGPGYYSRALVRGGAEVVAIDLGDENVAAAAASGLNALHSDGTCLPFPDATFDGVLCSNMLEHTPTPEDIFDEIERVLRPGGWAWVSWTNWYSPWGGHSITPWHYFGPRMGARLYWELFGPPTKNLPYDTLWPTYIGRTLRQLDARPGLRVLDAVPRYYPSQRWIMKIPGVREVLAWNCLLLLERTTAD